MLVVAALVVAVAAGVLLWRAGGEDDPYASYCSEVEERRDDLGAALSAGPTIGLLRALPSFEALAAEAPEDIGDEWDVVLDAVGGLDDALTAAGVDPATYDPAAPPADLAEEDRRAIEVAAVRLASQETAAAFAGVEQQARDVCQTPLSL